MSSPSEMPDDEQTADEQTVDEQTVADLLRLADPQQPMPADVQQRLMAGFTQELAAQVQSRKRKRWALALPASAAALLVFLLWPTPERLPPQPALATVTGVSGLVRAQGLDRQGRLRAGDALYSGDTLKPEAGALLTFQLKDHGVRLKSGSVLRVLEDSVYLQSGEVYVEGLSDKESASLTVDTAHGSVRDIGTQFLVISSTQGSSAIVRQGTIEVTTANSRLAAAATETQAIKLDLAEHALVPQAVGKWGPLWNWTQSLPTAFELEGSSLISYLDWVHRESGRTLRFHSDAVRQSARQSVLHGQLPRHQRAIDTLEHVMYTTRLQASLDETGDIVVQFRK